MQSDKTRGLVESWQYRYINQLESWLVRGLQQQSTICRAQLEGQGGCGNNPRGLYELLSESRTEDTLHRMLWQQSDKELLQATEEI